MNFIKIFLTNMDQSGSFYAGGIIKGTVELRYQQEIRVNSIKVNFWGQAHVEWEEIQTYRQDGYQRGYGSTTSFLRSPTGSYGSHGSHGSYGRSKYAQRYVRYRADKVFLNSSVTLVQGKDTRIAPGLVKYDFSYTLPTGLPPSLPRTETYFVEYKAIAVVNLHNGKEENFTRFWVKNSFDVTNFPDATSTYKNDEDKTISRCCKESLHISLHVQMTKRAFVPGEKIQVNCQVTNESKMKVFRIEGVITQTIIYSSMEPRAITKTNREAIAGYTYYQPADSADQNFNCVVDPIVPNDVIICNPLNTLFFLRVEHAVEVSLTLGDRIEFDPLVIQVFIGTPPQKKK